MFNLRSKAMSNRVHSPLQLFTVSLAFALCLFASSAAHAQGTAFSYQGHLTDAGNPAAGTFDIQFKLFDTPDTGTGTQLGVVTNSSVQVTNGTFNVQLDFSPCANCFDGTARFLEIALRPAGSTDPYTVLSPRQPLTATPYALHSATADTALNATQLGGQPASGFIQNTTMQQPGTSFNIGGNGTVGGTLSANTVNAVTSYDIGGFRVLSAPGAGNLFAGLFAGAFNTAGSDNSFFGTGAGNANTDGTDNSFFGRSAGALNESGNRNSFFGSGTGTLNRASDNSFFGANAGESNTGGPLNSLFGASAGASNTNGTRNSFLGGQAGISNIGGSENTIIGFDADVGFANLNNATAIGARAQVNIEDALVLGSISGVNGATASVNVGIGTTGPATRLDVVSTASQIRFGDNMGDDGGYLTSTVNSQAIISAGGKWNGSIWVAQATAASLISQFAGEISFLTNPSVTPSQAFTPTERVRISGNGLVGIGTAEPRAKLHIQGGNIFIAQPNSLVITSQNGACWFITVNNSGVLSTISVSCP